MLSPRKHEQYKDNRIEIDTVQNYKKLKQLSVQKNDVHFKKNIFNKCNKEITMNIA